MIKIGITSIQKKNSMIRVFYRPDGRKTQSTASEKFIRVTTTVNAKGDTIVRQQTKYNTDLRKYIGAFEISGNTWRVYHDAGHTDLNTSNGALTHRYYVRGNHK